MIYSLVPNVALHPIFVGVPRAHTNKYLNENSLNIKRFPADTLAYSSKSGKLQVAIILDGTARVYTDRGNEKALIRTLNAGDVFGVANLYDTGTPFPSRIITATDSTVMFIDGCEFKKFIENDSTATKNYLSFLSGRIVFLNKRLATLTAGSTEKKLAMFILDHTVNDRCVLPFSLSELAKNLNVGRASLYRDLDALERNGIIERNGKIFYIKDKNALSELTL